LSELAAKYEMHPNMLTNWKGHAIKKMADTFSHKVDRASTVREAQIKELHAKIGELTVEGIF